MTRTTSPTARRPRLRGVAAIEMALLIVPLLVLALGTTEVGRALYYYNTLLKSTRDASRWLSTQPAGTGYAIARCLAVYGNTGCTGETVVPNLTTAMVVVTPETAVGTGYGSLDVVTVSVQNYPFASFVPDIITDMVIGNVATTMRQVST